MSEDIQKSLNEVTNRYKHLRIKDASQDPGIWFIELFNLNLKFNKINSNTRKIKMIRKHPF